ncbi:phosphate ABC transporter substrate-binding protein [Coprobacter sp.]
MKQIKICLVVSLLLLSSAIYSQRIKGSDTVLPVSQQAAENFMQKYPKTRVTVTGGGSGVGISSLIDNTTDIAMLSRPVKFSEKMKLKEAKQDIKEVIIAYDALAVIVHPENPVNQLTRKQLENIFRGKITNWNQVGGNNQKIVVYTRETSSGTYEFFKENVLRNKNYMSGTLSMPATGAIIQSVSQTKGAIGYVGLAYLNDRTKALAISYDDKHFVLPSVSNSSKKLYPIVRPLYYYYNLQNEKKVIPFIQYLLSDEGQRIIKTNGYVPIR